MGWMPTTPLTDAGAISEPAVSVPIDAATRLADGPTAEPVLEPSGSIDRSYGLTTWPPSAEYPDGPPCMK